MLRFNKANRELWETYGQQYSAIDEQGRNYTLSHMKEANGTLM